MRRFLKLEVLEKNSSIMKIELKDGSEVCNVVVQRNKKIFDFTSSL